VARHRGTMSLHWVLGGVEFTILKPLYYVFFIFPFFQNFAFFFWF